MKISEQKYLALSGVRHEKLNVWLEEEWLIPSELSVEISVFDIDLARAHFIRDLQRDLGSTTTELV